MYTVPAKQVATLPQPPEMYPVMINAVKSYIGKKFIIFLNSRDQFHLIKLMVSLHLR